APRSCSRVSTRWARSRSPAPWKVRATWGRPEPAWSTSPDGRAAGETAGADAAVAGAVGAGATGDTVGAAAGGSTGRPELHAATGRTSAACNTARRLVAPPLHRGVGGMHLRPGTGCSLARREWAPAGAGSGLDRPARAARRPFQGMPDEGEPPGKNGKKGNPPATVGEWE